MLSPFCMLSGVRLSSITASGRTQAGTIRRITREQGSAVFAVGVMRAREHPLDVMGDTSSESWQRIGVREYSEKRVFEALTGFLSSEAVSYPRIE